ncbi:MAG: baseplate J/gp47 family protein [Deltaproteobacteria bacterium]|nr:baseplate J/gp47 family protein [Myxococcales bacterium]MDP3219751.1 baseplate J/gp47 family protein [Deltaproteobacteria bacterium]
MPFTPRVAATIRDALLADLRARYLALTPPQDIAIEEGTPAYNDADALSKALEPTEYLAGQAAARVLLRGQFGTELDQTAHDDGTSRDQATKARLSVPVTGPSINGTTALNGATLSEPGGLRFVPIDPDTGAALTSITVDGSAQATLTVECTTAGVEGNLATPATLTWSTAPTGYAATAATSAIARAGTAAESDVQLQTRLVERRRARPGSGNPADIRQQLLDFAGVDEVFVHPCMGPDGIFALGCFTAVVLGAPAGDSTAPGIFYDAPTGSPRTQALMKRYLLGEVDADGAEIPEALREGFLPGPIHPDNITIVTPGATGADVVVTVTTSVDYPPSFVGSYVVAVSPAPTTTTFSTTAGITVSPDVGALVPDDLVAINVSTVAKRGGFALGKILTAAGTSVVLAEALPAAPVAGTTVYPTTAAWQAIREAVFAAVDNLGSGTPTISADTNPGNRLGRFPTESWGRPATLRASQLIAAIMAIPGVTDVTVTINGTSSAVSSSKNVTQLATLTIVPG